MRYHLVDPIKERVGLGEDHHLVARRQRPQAIGDLRVVSVKGLEKSLRLMGVEHAYGKKISTFVI